MLSRSTPSSSMQKTYDECYLICSTAVYFEKQNNEDEALRSWRSALDSIYYHNAYRIPANYKPRSETERALQDSLRDMELQCKERVDLLDALRKSREESKEQDTNGEAVLASPTLRNMRSASNLSASSLLGKGSVAPVNYPDIAKPPLPQRPSLQIRPASGTIPSRPIDSGRSKSSSVVPPPVRKTPSPALDVPTKKQSRTPSPEKKPGLLRSTLRPHGSGPVKNGTSARLTAASLRPRAAAPASKAATLAWPTGSTSTVATTATKSNLTSQPGSGSGRSSGYAVAPSGAFTKSSAVVDAPASPNLSSPKMRSKKLRGSHIGPKSELLGQAEGSALHPPTPPPHRDPITAFSGQEEATDSNDILSPTSLPPAEFPAYRREYSSMAPAIDSKQAQRMAANLHGNLSSYSKTTIPGSPQRHKSPGRTRSAERKKAAPPPVPRKAIGSPTTRKPLPRHTRDLSDAATSSDLDPDSARSDDPVITDTEAEVIAELGGNQEDHIKAQDTAWDRRVKQLMKNLPKGVDEQAAKAIFNEVVIQGDEVQWDDVAGLDIAKSALKEAVVYPFLRPDLFRGLREPARGMLLFGPPGTGKTMLARAVATESRSTFFAISASSLTSKYLGESEKLVRALFSIAKVLTPSIIFVDEIDSLLSARSGSGEHEATRRIKTEFLIQWSDLAKAAAGREDKDKSAGDASRVLVLAATNLPWAIDEAARRRFVRRQYIPLPEAEVRESQLRRLLSAQKTSLHDKDLAALVILTDGYSGSDITALAKDAAMGPLRSLGERLLHMSPEDIRPISIEDFESSLVNIRPSVSKEGLQEYEDWARQFGERGG